MFKRIIFLLTAVLLLFAGCSAEALPDESSDVPEEDNALSADSLSIVQAEFDGMLASVKTEDGFWGFIGKDGEEKIVCQYLSAGNFSEGLAWVEAEDGLFGYVTPSGAYAEFLHPSFSFASDFSSGAALVTDKNSDYFYINRSGGLFFQNRIVDYGTSYWEAFLNGFNYATTLQNGVALGVESNPNTGEDEYYLFKADGTVLMKLDARWTQDELHSAAEALPDENGYCIVGKESGEKTLYGVINLSGNQVLPAEYEEILPYSDGLFAVKKDGLWGFVDSSNQVVIEIKYREARSFFQGVAPVKEKDYWGLISKTGEKIGRFLYEEVSENGFSENLLAVCQKGLWGYLDHQGNFVIPAVLFGAGDFREGTAIYQDEAGKFGYINTLGEIIVEARYLEAKPFCKTE